MKITMYELLGMIKDGKAPKKIKYENREYYLYDNKSYLTTDKTRFFDRIYFSDLNIELEIIEEPRDIEVCGSLFTKSEYDKLAHSEEKKIPEKLKWNEKSQHNIVTDNTKKTLEHLLSRSEQLKKSINQIVDYLDYLKSKGE